MDAHKKTLGELIFSEEFKKYSVPLYQRPYSWKPDHIDNFWEDLTDGKINFIGPIVIHEEVVKKTTEKGKKIKITERTVVDGQQRLITSTIFASILRDIFKALDRQYTGENFQKIAFNIQQRYIIAEHIDGRTKDYKLQTADETSSFLRPYIQDDEIWSQYKRVNDLFNSKKNNKNNLIPEKYYNKIKKEYDYKTSEITDKKTIKKIEILEKLEAETDEHKRIKENYTILYEKVIDHIGGYKKVSKEIESIQKDIESIQKDNNIDQKDGNEMIKEKKEMIKKIQTSDINKKKDLLLELEDDLKRMEVVEITIEDESSAYEVFERLNDYGLDLTQADLIKNHVLKNIEKKSDKIEYQNTWNKIGKRVGEKNLTSFIRYFWMSRNPFTQKNKLYKTINDSKVDSKDFIDDLDSASKLYVNITDEDYEFKSLKTKTKNLPDQVNQLKNLAIKIGTTQIYTFFISLLSIIERKQLIHDPSEFLLLLENFLFQYFAIGSNPGNAVERKFSDISNKLEKSLTEKDIKAEQNKIFDEYKNEFKELYKEKVNKENFMESFKKLEYVEYRKGKKKYEINKYILVKYEYYLLKKKKKSIKEIALKVKNLNKEHLLPQKPDNWNLKPEDIKDYVHSLGNIFLIDISINNSLQNSNLKKKMEKLVESNLPSVKEIVKRYGEEKEFDWNEEEIYKRMDNIADAAWDHIWKIDTKKNKAKNIS